MVNPRIKIATLQSVLSALLKVDDIGSPLHCCILLFSAVCDRTVRPVWRNYEKGGQTLDHTIKAEIEP